MPDLSAQRTVSPLPPLAAIRVFEAAARHLSFTAAATELGMTQAAVSYQIKVLEERVGGPLFLRKPRQVVLTEAGQRLAPKVSEAFTLLMEAYGAARSGADGVLTVSTLLTFASNWLAQHLGLFQLAHPALAGVSTALFATDASLALFAPSPYKKPIKADAALAHKILMGVAAAGFLSELILGPITAAQGGSLNQRNLAIGHLVTGYTSFAAMLGGYLSYVF